MISLDEEAKGGAEEMEADADLYQQTDKQGGDLFTDELAFDFSVRNPQDFGGHIVYEVKGRDDQGLFECKRRFNEFFLLHEQLTKRWPGCLIPKLPAKQKFGNKDLVFIQERRYYLERFLRKLARFGFIINGQEFQMFARPQSPDVEKALGKLPKMTAQDLYERMTQATLISELEYEDQQKMRYENAITEFRGYIKKVDPFLKQLKVDLSKFLSTK
jgi:sorting nexin-1/2/sorting nexin-4